MSAGIDVLALIDHGQAVLAQIAFSKNSLFAEAAHDANKKMAPARAAVAELIDALAKISLSERDSTTAASDKAHDMARIAQTALAKVSP